MPTAGIRTSSSVSSPGEVRALLRAAPIGRLLCLRRYAPVQDRQADVGRPRRHSDAVLRGGQVRSRRQSASEGTHAVLRQPGAQDQREGISLPLSSPQSAGIDAP